VRSSQLHDLHVITAAISGASLLGLHAEKFATIHYCLR